VDVALGWNVDFPHDHVRSNDYLFVCNYRTRGLQTTVVGSMRALQRRWRNGFSFRNIEKEICKGGDYQGGV